MTTTTDRRENLLSVYLFIVDEWAVYVPEIVEGTGLTKEQVTSLLGTLERKNLIAGTHVNNEPRKIWQSYYDIQNGGSRQEAQNDFFAAFPNKVADTKSPTPVAKNAPDDGDIVYRVKKTRNSGAETDVVFLGRAVKGERWTVNCRTHDTTRRVMRRMDAEHLAHHPEDWCEDCQVIDTTNQHEQVERDLNPRYTVQEISVGSAGLTARPAVIDTVEGRTIKVFQGKNGMANAAKHAEKLNKVSV